MCILLVLYISQGRYTFGMIRHIINMYVYILVYFFRLSYDENWFDNFLHWISVTLNIIKFNKNEYKRYLYIIKILIQKEFVWCVLGFNAVPFLTINEIIE